MEALAALFLARSRFDSVSPGHLLAGGRCGDPADSCRQLTGRVHRCLETSCPVHVLRWGVCWGGEMHCNKNSIIHK